MTGRAEVVYQFRRDGTGGVVWVRARHGWRRITFAGRVLGLLGILSRLGAATTTVLPVGCLLVPQTVPGAGVAFPALPRPGPSPLAPNAP